MSEWAWELGRQQIIEKIESEIRDMPQAKTRTSDWKEKQEQYSQVASSFMFLKDAWRNYQIEAAKRTYHRFGQYSTALDKVRALIEHQPVEKAELERMLSALNVPGDFDVAQISWRPDYDPFFYQQLARRAQRIYLFRDEYIFDLEKVVVVETPQLGNATYLFVKPGSMAVFLAAYTKVSKDDIRGNRENIGERLGFLGRIIHGNNPRDWKRRDP